MWSIYNWILTNCWLKNYLFRFTWVVREKESTANGELSLKVHPLHDDCNCPQGKTRLVSQKKFMTIVKEPKMIRLLIDCENCTVIIKYPNVTIRLTRNGVKKKNTSQFKIPCFTIYSFRELRQPYGPASPTFWLRDIWVIQAEFDSVKYSPSYGKTIPYNHCTYNPLREISPFQHHIIPIWWYVWWFASGITVSRKKLPKLRHRFYHYL